MQRLAAFVLPAAVAALVPFMGASGTAGPIAQVRESSVVGLPVVSIADRMSGAGGGGAAGRHTALGLISDSTDAPAAEAGIVLDCGQTSYRIVVEGGTCTAGDGAANCTAPDGGKASASCSKGCETTEKNGRCAVATAE